MLYEFIITVLSMSTPLVGTAILCGISALWLDR